MSDSSGGGQTTVSTVLDDLEQQEQQQINITPGGNLLENFAGLAANPSAALGVFEKGIRTVTGQNRYEMDQAEQDFKLLNQSGIASPSAMAGLKAGPHQTNVRGDSVMQVTGDSNIQVKGDSVIHIKGGRYCKVDGVDDLVVSGTQTYQVKNDARLLYNQNRTVVVGEAYDLAVKGPSTTFVLGESSEQFVGKHEVTTPEEFEWKHFERGFSYQKLDLASFALDIHSTAADIHVIDAELAVFESKSKILSEKKEAGGDHIRAAVFVLGVRLAVEESVNPMLEDKPVTFALMAAAAGI